MSPQTQRKVVAYELLSLDGVAEAPETFVTDWDAESDAHLAELIATQDAVLLGRRSHDEWSGFWPTSDIEPFASFINAVTKYVATSGPLDREWTNVHAIEGDAAEFVRQLKQQPGGDIGVHASISLTRSLLAAGVVDELRVLIAPVIAGSGRRLLDDLSGIGLRTLRSSTTPSGHLLVDYQVLGG